MVPNASRWALKSSIVRIPMAGGEAVPVTSGDSADSNPAWSRDGKQVAFLSVRADVPRIWVIDPEVRSATEVKDSVAETQGEVAIDWLADGRLLWTVPGSQNYAVRDVRSGAQEMLLPPPAKKEEQHGWLNDVRVSPDGKQLAVWWNRPIGDEDDGLWMIEWPSRQFRKLLPGDFYPAGWSPDSQSIYAYEYLGRRMMKISASTGKAQDIGAFPLGALEGCDISPDAKTAICTVRQTQSDAWLIENFDPKIAANPQK